MREAGDVRIRLALYADDVHLAATCHHAFGNHQRQASAAGKYADGTAAQSRQAR
jgi:hypothetical protein